MLFRHQQVRSLQTEQAIADGNQSGASMVASIAGSLPIQEASEINMLAKHLSRADAAISSGKAGSSGTERKIQQ